MGELHKNLVAIGLTFLKLGAFTSRTFLQVKQGWFAVFHPFHKSGG
jgi:hypothetical protein